MSPDRNEMKQRFLADASEQELEEAKPNLTEMQYLRAKHFYSENLRVRNAINALKEENEQAFLDAINGSRLSSTNNLKNMMVGEQYEGSPLEACDLVMEATENHGAVKINGGGFAGSVISIIPTKYLKTAMSKLKKKYGNENVVEIYIREDGPKTLYKL